MKRSSFPGILKPEWSQEQIRIRDHNRKWREDFARQQEQAAAKHARAVARHEAKVARLAAQQAARHARDEARRAAQAARRGAQSQLAPAAPPPPPPPQCKLCLSEIYHIIKNPDQASLNRRIEAYN